MNYTTEESYYYLFNKLKLVSYVTNWFDEMQYQYDFNVVESTIFQIKEQIEDLNDNPFDIPLIYNFGVILRRIKKPINLITRDSLKIVMKNVQEDEMLIIDHDGNVYSRKKKEYDYIKMEQFPVVNIQSYLNEIDLHSKEFELLYLSLLSAWHDHLKYNRSERITDSDLEILQVEQFNEGKLLSSIAIEINTAINILMKFMYF